MIDVISLEKSYMQPGIVIPVLKNIELHAKAGESVAIIGESGAGKSTLLSMLAGLDNPSSGEIIVAGQHLETMDEASLAMFRARHMGIVFQQFHLISTLTALENVSLPLEITRQENAKERATEALAKVGLSKRMRHFPSQMSGGECQRVAIARAFVSEPAIILADEPSGNLDSKTGSSVMDLLFSLAENKNTTLILVTHSNELAKKCRHTYVLEDGVLKPRNL